jgi:hypothetical protein
MQINVDTTGIRRLQKRLEKQSGHAKRSIAAAANRVAKKVKNEIADKVLQEANFKKTKRDSQKHYDSVYEPLKITKAKPGLGAEVMATVSVQMRPKPWLKYFDPQRVAGPGGGAIHNWYAKGPEFVPGAFGFDDKVGGRLGRGPWKRERGAGRLPIQQIKGYSVWGVVRRKRIKTQMKKRVKRLMREELEILSRRYSKGGTE